MPSRAGRGHDACFSFAQEARMRNQDELEGKARELKGKAKQAFGDMTENERIKNEGVEEEIAGETQAGVGKARRKVGEFIEDLGEDIKR
jgi:uncharacterized protein YjbJ (UPF0337 family)